MNREVEALLGLDAEVGPPAAGHAS